MDLPTTTKLTKAEQCKRNAKEKSEKKRRVAYEALSALLKEGCPVTKAAVAKRARVSVVFVRSHPDLVQAIEKAENVGVASLPTSSGEKAKDQVVAALQRRLEKMKEDLAAKDIIIRQKEREIEILYGKLASGRSNSGS